MRTSIYILLAAIGIFTVTGSCDKLVYKYNPNFEGTWRTATAYSDLYEKTVTSEIVIDKKDGIYNYACTDVTGCAPRLCNCISQQQGKAVINTSHTQIKFGSSSGAYPVNVDTEPYQDAQGIWRMEVNGELYTKQ